MIDRTFPFTRRRAIRMLFATAAATATAVPIVASARRSEIFADRQGVAINGYDAVSYFNADRPTPGSKDHAFRWKGASWLFASDAARQAFIADPERYAPQYGGYCAYAVAKGYVAKTEPDAYSLRDGRLYLNYSKGVRSLWLKDVDRYIRDGDRNWPDVL